MFRLRKIYAIVLSLIFTSSLFFILGYHFGNYDKEVGILKQSSPVSNSSNVDSNLQQNIISEKKCVNYGLMSKDDFLLPYHVQKGDTLFSILKNNDGGGTAKINELIEINKDVYPGLSLQNPFIEVGWKLYLPPKYAGMGSGTYGGIKGEILEMNDSYFLMNIDPDKRSQIAIYITPFTQYVPNDYKFSKGTCVRVVYDRGNSNKAISIVAQ